MSRAGAAVQADLEESELLDAIRPRGQSEITIAEMQHITGWSYSVINKMLHGQNAGGYHYSGLLDKCPAIPVCDRTLVTEKRGCVSQTRGRCSKPGIRMCMTPGRLMVGMMWLKSAKNLPDAQ